MDNMVPLVVVRSKSKLNFTSCGQKKLPSVKTTGRELMLNVAPVFVAKLAVPLPELYLQITGSVMFVVRVSFSAPASEGDVIGRRNDRATHCSERNVYLPYIVGFPSSRRAAPVGCGATRHGSRRNRGQSSRGWISVSELTAHTVKPYFFARWRAPVKGSLPV